MDWHSRYLQQAAWTAALRGYLFQSAGIGPGARILETGCGSGAVLRDISGKGDNFRSLVGIDIDHPALLLAQQETGGRALFARAQAASLPFPTGSFDAACCHYLLLWTKDPVEIVCEMARVTRSGGAVLALAEPDYTGRIDYPPELAQVGKLQEQALRRQGANPGIGRSLLSIFTRAGLHSIQGGVLGGEWRQPANAGAAGSQLEWEVLAADLQGMIPADELQRLRQLDQDAWQRGDRVLFVPTFYAWGVIG